jgi:hypothetical protein
VRACAPCAGARPSFRGSHRPCWLAGAPVGRARPWRDGACTAPGARLPCDVRSCCVMHCACVLEFARETGLRQPAGAARAGKPPRGRQSSVFQETWQLCRACCSWLRRHHACTGCHEIPMNSPGCALRQVVGPHAAGRWLAETAPALGLRFRFVACRSFDAQPGPERAAVLHALGARAPGRPAHQGARQLGLRARCRAACLHLVMMPCAP